MKKILVVCDYSTCDTVNKLAKKYPGVLWLRNYFMPNTETCRVVIEMVRIADKVMFLNDNVAYEVAATAYNKEICNIEDYPLEEEDEAVWD